MNDYTLDTRITVHPNSANQYFKLEMDPNEVFRIYNSIGSEIIFLLDRNNSIVNCSGWLEGIYFIHTKKHRYKLIIKH